MAPSSRPLAASGGLKILLVLVVGCGALVFFIERVAQPAGHSQNKVSVTTNAASLVDAEDMRQAIKNKDGRAQGDLKGISGGEFSVCTRLKTYGLNFDHGLANFVVKQLHPASMFDFGSGLGLYVDYMTQRGGTEAIGIEPDGTMHVPEIFQRSSGPKPKALTVNIFKLSPAELNQLRNILGKFELVYSVEVVEHIPRHLHTQFFDFFVTLAKKWILFGASPHFGGVGHISPRPIEEWKSELTSRGMVFMPTMTDALRRACDKNNANHGKDVMLFRVPSFQAEDKIDPAVFVEQIPTSQHATIEAELWPELSVRTARLHSGKESCTPSPK